MQSDRAQISDDWKHYFSRDELIETVKWKFGKEFYSKLNLDKTSSSELIILLEDDYFLLSFILQKLEKMTDIKKRLEINRTSLSAVLDQLQIGYHYLRDKRIRDFDEYDVSNAENLFRKAGWIKRVYGIYSIDVKLQEVHLVTSPPKVFYDTEERALIELQRMIDESECKKDMCKIIPLEFVVNHA